MRVEAVQQMMAVLPDCFHYNQGSALRNIAEALHAALLAVDEAVLLDRIVRMAAPDLEAFGANGGHYGLFGAQLRRPALLVGGESQIAVSDKNDGIGHSHILACGMVES